MDGSREGEDLFLDVRSQVVEPHDLGHAGGRDLAVVGQLALVDDDAVADKVTTTMGQGQQSRDPWNAAKRFDGSFAVGERLAAVASSGYDSGGA